MKRRPRKDATVEDFFREVFDSLARKVLEETAESAPPTQKAERLETKPRAAPVSAGKRRRKERTH